MNRLSALLHSTGVLMPERMVTLEVPGRRTGRLISFPLVVADYQNERYLVSMLGEKANWVGNVRAAKGEGLLRHGRSERIVLEEVPIELRAPVLRRYLAVAPGARAHIPVDRRASPAEFEAIADRFPVFRIVPPTVSSAGG
ncbi:nitroreductase family deazaflavin-dependent oxidoreductase [Nonomuraea sp. CA-143628]|uniref:nitroreductase family deazaflavin-dependent oxidoreductase n=1 Tax=Nonomuraea sp. CA-143628 TaxID=3239997 RepID=UPI003D906AB4